MNLSGDIIYDTFFYCCKRQNSGKIKPKMQQTPNIHLAILPIHKYRTIIGQIERTLL